MMTPLETVLDRLNKVRKQGAGFTACCPAHDDRSPSLAVSEGSDGRVLLKCWAGCRYSQIMAAIGLDDAAGFVRTGSQRQRPSISREALLDEVNIVRIFEAIGGSDTDRQRYEEAKRRLGVANV